MEEYERRLIQELQSRESPAPPLPETLRRACRSRSPSVFTGWKGPLAAAAAVFILFFGGAQIAPTRDLGSRGLKTWTGLSRELSASPVLCALKWHWNLPCREAEGLEGPSKGETL